MIHLAAMTSIFPDWTLDQALPILRSCGYTGLEARVEWGHRSGIEANLSPAERAEVRRKVEDQGLQLCAVATSVRSAVADATERSRQMESLRRYIDLAADLGAKCVRTFGGERPQGVELKYVIDYVAEAYASVVGYAGERGVTVLMETHDYWSHSSEVRAVAEQVNHPSFGVLWDIMHPERMFERPDETFANIGRFTRHVHAHDGIYPGDGRSVQIVPLGEGVFDHASPLSLLSQAGFDGFVSVEVIHEPGSDHDAEGVLRQYAEALRRLLPA